MTRLVQRRSASNSRSSHPQNRGHGCEPRKAAESFLQEINRRPQGIGERVAGRSVAPVVSVTRQLASEASGDACHSCYTVGLSSCCAPSLNRSRPEAEAPDRIQELVLADGAQIAYELALFIVLRDDVRIGAWLRARRNS